MKTQEYVKSLFKHYEETAELKDFMEELQSNLEDRIESLVKKGAPRDEAFTRAAGELGDITALADELSLKRRREILEDAYLGIRKYLNPVRVAAYVLFGAVLLCGLVIGAIAYFAVPGGVPEYSGGAGQIVGMFGVILAFLCVAAPGFTFLGLTQETASLRPMGIKRALWYGAASLLISFGITVFPLTYFAVKYSPDTAGDLAGLQGTALIGPLGTLLPFLIPGAALLVFLILTEKDRRKPWARVRPEAEWPDPAAETRFGLFSGAIWLFAAGFFFLLGCLWTFKLAWLIFIFAVAVQLVLQGLCIKPGSRGDEKEKPADGVFDRKLI